MVYERFRNQDYEDYFVIYNDDVFRRPDAAYCRQVRAQYGLTMPVLYDPSGALSSVNLDNRHVHFVLETGAVVNFRDAFNDTRFEGAIQALLGP